MAERRRTPQSDAEAMIRTDRGTRLTHRRKRSDPLHPAERGLAWELQAQHRGCVPRDHARDLIEAARKHAAAADLPSDLRTRLAAALEADPERSWHAVLRGLRP